MLRTILRRSRLSLAAAPLLAACGQPAAQPHGEAFARQTLSHDGFAWQTIERPGVHLHYLPGSYAAAHADDFARRAQAAVRHDLTLAAIPAPREPVELFMVNSREQGKELIGHEYMGTAIPGELTTFFVAVPGKPPAFRHEIMHALSLKYWGRHRTGTWIAEGVATWAGGSCQGHTVDQIAAGFLHDGTLPPLRDLAARFWESDELHGYITGGSAVGFIARRGGPAAVQALWRGTQTLGTHPLGTGGDEIEAAWRRHLATVPPAHIDMDALRLHGCEQP